MFFSVWHLIRMFGCTGSDCVWSSHWWQQFVCPPSTGAPCAVPCSTGGSPDNPTFPVWFPVSQAMPGDSRDFLAAPEYKEVFLYQDEQQGFIFVSCFFLLWQQHYKCLLLRAAVPTALNLSLNCT